ncbi:MAG: transcriptional regulator, partial [Euryarchaeota archaeon]|nr:transcriptional regulator [Euryarchaeota archaeon]
EFITLTKNKFFGFSAVNIAGEAVNISDREKTIIDALDHPEYCGGISEAAKALWSARQKIDFRKLVDYAEKMKNRGIFKRLGYLLQKLEIKIPDGLNKKVKENISKGYASLDTVAMKKGRHNSEWRLLVNVSDKDLLEWREIH